MNSVVETRIGSISNPIDRFFAFARERHQIYLRRQTSPKPWTQDPILQEYSFTNVFRQLDRTTQWYTNHVLTNIEPEQILLATVVFRWFNRIRTGEAIFCSPGLDNKTAFDLFCEKGETVWLKQEILELCGNGPYVTGAYVIQTRGAGEGLSKLDGVLKLIELFYQRLPAPHWTSLQEGFLWLQESPSMGPFMAYEVVTDLRHTILRNATDIMTWANPGPGAKRGLNRIHNRELRASIDDKDYILEMQKLLLLSRITKYWCWEPWEMREVEHTLCEFDKYERARLGQGRPKAKYQGGK